MRIQSGSSAPCRLCGISYAIVSKKMMVTLKQRKLGRYDTVMGVVAHRTGQGVVTKADFDSLLSPSGG